jgi:hypothetical protein
MNVEITGLNVDYIPVNISEFGIDHRLYSNQNAEIMVTAPPRIMVFLMPMPLAMLPASKLPIGIVPMSAIA